VTRAGANSVAEVAANAVPALFLPYPHHRDRHQEHNARPLVERGAAEMVGDRVEPEANVQHVGPVLRALMHDAARRADMRARLESNRPPNGADVIARLLLSEI
jgi:UDP-N-acetylglucosamine--N-acetylmuramyl-(pentapeptide) pyrophosphoryl-undecaprenol N-acetylglucosamine transferase